MKFHQETRALFSRPRPKCETCPKFLLHKDWQRRPGLHPANELALDLYDRVRGERFRAGTMEGLYLLSTLSPQDVQVVLDEHDDLFADRLARQSMFHKLLLVDNLMTAGKSEAEEKQREKAREAAKNGRG